MLSDTKEAFALRVNNLSSWKQVFPGIELRLLAWDEECMPVFVRAKPRSVASSHKHKSKQYGYVIKGSVSFRTPDGEHHAKAGESYLIESNEEHSAIFGPENDIQLLEVFVPARKELLG